MGSPVKLGFFAKRDVLRCVPLMPSGATYGYISSGLAMPKGGACYVAAFDNPANTSKAHIVAYIDWFGRAFSFDEPLVQEPLRDPDLVVYTCGNNTESMDVGNENNMVLLDGNDNATSPARLDVFLGDGSRRTVAEARVVNVDNTRKAEFSYTAIDDSFPGKFEVANPTRYLEFMSTAYLAFVEFARCTEWEPISTSDDSATNGTVPNGAFDLAAIFSRFQQSDFFDAINREVLEAETSWTENPERARGIERFLVNGLRDSGLVGISADTLTVEGATEGPNARLIRTSRYSNLFFLDFVYNTQTECLEDGAFTSCDATRDMRHKLLRAEGAINRFLMVSNFLESEEDDTFEQTEEEISKLADSFVEHLCVQAPDPNSPLEAKGRWDTHVAIAQAGELWRAPYRIPYEFCLNEACTEVGFDLAVPCKSTMAQTHWNDDVDDYLPYTPIESSTIESRYAAHAALLTASSAFHASASIEKVYVNCLRDGNKEDIVISVEFDRKTLCDAYSASKANSFSEPFETLSRFNARFKFEGDNGLCNIEKLFSLGKGDFKSSFERLVAIDTTPFNEKARDMLHVDCPMRMSIFEDGQRRAYADEVSAALDVGVENAELALKQIHDRTEDLLVRDICTRLLAAFSEGALGETSFLEVKEAFMDAYGLKPAMMRASSLMRDDDPAAIGLLEELAAQGDAIDGFNDTSRVCYRYFDSYETRAIYAKRCLDDAKGRIVNPLADEVFLAHDSLAQELTTTITGANEALRHAQRCIELSPARAYSYLRAARAYFMKDDYENEVKMCCKALEVTWRADDAGLAFYWLAYSFWKLEKYDAAVACYKRCSMLNSYMASEAKTELDELLSSVKGLKRHSIEEDEAILEAHGVPLNALTENAEFLLAAAKETIDSSAVSLGCIFAAAGVRILRDDAIVPALRALNVTM